MKTSVCALAVVLAGMLFRAAAEEVPLLKDLRKPVEVVQEAVEEGPILPKAVDPANRVADPALLCPAGAVWYVTVPDAARLVGHWLESPSGALMNEPSMARMFQNNRFGLNFLFSDLPASVVIPSRVGAVAAAFELSNSFAKMSERMAMACYIDDDGRFSFLFLFDIGLERVPAFETIGEWETYFFLSHPGSDVVRGDHSGNHLDVWTLQDRGADRQPSQVAAGFAENMAVVSNNPELAAACLALLSGGDSVAESRWGKRLTASLTTSASADAIAFLRMDALLAGLEETPIARHLVADWADYLGHGGKDDEAIYYGLEFTSEGSRETFLLPASGQSAHPSLIELLAKRLRPVEKWSTPVVFPYQPNPSLFFAACIEGRQLGGMLRQERRLFGDPEAEGLTFPMEARRLFTNDVLSVLTGEIGMAFYPGSEGASSWLMVLPCDNSPEGYFDRGASQIERSGARIYSQDGGWRGATSWTVATPARFPRLAGNFMLIASEGDLLVAAIDNLVGPASFAANRDFTQSLAKSEASQGLLFYLNTPEILGRQYPNLPALMRQLYPRASGLNSRPPLAMLRRYAKGVLGTIAPAANGEEFTRMTVQAPLPTLGALSAGLVLSFPSSLREDGRRAMAQSRENLQNIWLRLQLYASRFGHFPDSLADLAADMRAPDVTSDAIRALFTAPAALPRMDAREASEKSYRYLSSATPNDEPDIPLVYEAEPWSEDFTGWYPAADSGRGRSESGEYLSYRQYIRLDGTVVVIPEKRFLEKVLPRIQERE